MFFHTNSSIRGRLFVTDAHTVRMQLTSPSVPQLWALSLTVMTTAMAFVSRLLCEHEFSSLLRRKLSENFLGPMRTLFNFWGTTRLFLKMSVHIYIPSGSDGGKYLS